MIDKSSKIYSLFKIMIILSGMQVLRIIINLIVFQFVEKNVLNSDLTTILEMLIFTILLLLVWKQRNINLSIFPYTQSIGGKIGYVILTVIIVLLIISTPFFNGGFSSYVVIPLILSAAATPVFEELIFRGYVWTELKNHYTNEFIVYIISTIFFAIWHLGYADSIWFRVTLMGDNSEFLFIMFMKVITGLCFGIITGFVRYKLKNCYASILAHSFMNIFGR